MAYEPLNLQNGQTLTAEDLQHMEQGIANVLPQNPGAYQYPATDGDGNMVWADRLAWDEQSVAGKAQFTYDEFTDAGNGIKKITQYGDTGSLTVVNGGGGYNISVDGNLYTNLSKSNGTLWSYYDVSFFGNASLADATFDDSGESVCYFTGYSNIDYTSTVYGLYVRAEDFTDVVVYGMNIRQFQTIDPKFLPAIRGTAFYVNVTQTDTDTYTADKTYTEISNAITNGLIPYCVYGNYLLPMVNSTSGMLSGIAPALAVSKNHNFFAVVPNTSNSNQFDFINVFIDQYNDVFVRSKEFSFTS